MATSTWKLTTGNGNWSGTGDWTPAAPNVGDDVVIGSSLDTGNIVVTEDVTVAVASLTLAAAAGKKASYTTTLVLTSTATLTVDGAISLGQNTIIDGTGTLIANGVISGAGSIVASGGLLGLSGSGSVTSSGPTLSIGTAVPSTLELNLSGGVTTGAITINDANQTLEIGPAGWVTITASERVVNGAILMAGGLLTDSSGIVFGVGRSSGELVGFGTVNASLSRTGSGSANLVQAAGGTLDLLGSIASGILLVIDASAPADLKIDGTATATDPIVISNANQTLKIGAVGSLTLQVAESITNGTIQLDGGTLTDSYGLVIGSGAQLVGKGVVAGTFSGSGTVKASGGVLDLTSGVTSAAASFVIDSSPGSVLELAGPAAAGTTFGFLGQVGALELADVASGVVQGFSGTIAGLSVGTSAASPTNAVNIQAPVTSAILSGNQITVLNGSTTVATLQLTAAPAAAYAAVAADSALGGYDVFLTSAAPASPTVSWSPAAASGVEGQAIALGTITPSGGSGSYSSVLVSGIPVGATLADATHSFTAAAGNTAVDILGWNYAGLSVTPPGDSNFSLSVAVTDSLGNTSAPAGEAMTVDPLAPTVAPAAVSGATGQAIALDLGLAVNGLGGDSNSLDAVTLSNLPSGATLSDSGGYTLTISSGSITFSASQIAAGYLTGLALTATSAGTFTLGVAATEQDAEGDLGAAATATETVAVSGTTSTGVPAFDHIVLVVEENQGYNDIIDSSQAPYINNTLVAGGALLTNYFAATHPSEPNYLALYGGSTFGVTDNNEYSFPDPTLYTVLKSGGKTFTGYYESPQEWASSPWLSFPESDSVESNFSNFPTSNFSTLPTVSIVVPNLNDSMHDGTIQQGDTWLQQHIDSYAQWAGSHNSLLILTWDEDNYDNNNQVANIFYGADVAHGTYGALYNHYDTLSTLVAGYGLTGPRDAATAAPIDVFQH